MSIGFARLSRFPAPLMALWLAAAAAPPAVAAAADGQALVRANCSGCHLEHDGRFERISAIRKSPEGWVMTLFRMQNVHGLKLAEDAEAGILRYLADTQGLAPSESAAGRFALERRPNVKDLDQGPEMMALCGRCHTLARASLQRRDADEWLKLAHMHVGQFPSLEYQASSRDRPWWQIATTRLPGELAARYPFETPAWTAWRAAPRHEPVGSWVVAGHEPGGRDLFGTAEIVGDGSGGYRATYHLSDGAGHEVTGESHAVVYTGYEWRGRGALGGRAAREIYALDESGNRLRGRWFDPAHSEEGGDFQALRAAATPEVLALVPRALKAGTSGTLTVVGTGLGDGSALRVGAGVSLRVTGHGDGYVTASVTVAADAAPGARPLMSGTAATGGALAVYRQVDRIDVEPGYGIARLGGGRLDAVSAQFEAIGQTRLADGSFLSLGPLAAEWHARPFDAEAKRSDDVRFAGRLEANGRFLPAGAGPNKAREFSGDNVGNLAIVARVHDGSGVVDGQGHLIVTVQRWNNPPIY